MVKIITEENYKKIIKNPEKYNIEIRFSHEDKVYKLSKQNISEMLVGAYRNFRQLKVDEDYFINVNSVYKTICELVKVSLVDKKKPISIENIRTFYIKNYYLVTKEEFNGKTHHKISEFLVSTGHINRGRLENKDLYSTKNTYKVYQYYNGIKIPKDLFHPIRLGINDTFFSDHFFIDNLEVKTNIKIVN